MPTTNPLSAPLALGRPHYGIATLAAMKRFFRKYATFSGRASRSEFWWVALLFAVFYTVLLVLATALGDVGAPADQVEPGPVSLVLFIAEIVVWLATLVPWLALSVRRLHDANISGLVCVSLLVPYIGGLVLAIFALLPSNPQGSRFDADPTRFF